MLHDFKSLHHPTRSFASTPTPHKRALAPLSSNLTPAPCDTRCSCSRRCGVRCWLGTRHYCCVEHVSAVECSLRQVPLCVLFQQRSAALFVCDALCIAVEEMRRRVYSRLLLANNDVIIPPSAVPQLLNQLHSYDLIVPISSRHGSGFGSESCCLCPSGIVTAQSWAVAAAELPLCAAAVQRRLAADAPQLLHAPYGRVWVDPESGIGPLALGSLVMCACDDVTACSHVCVCESDIVTLFSHLHPPPPPPPPPSQSRLSCRNPTLSSDISLPSTAAP